MHAEPKLTISMIRQKFWIPLGQDAVRCALIAYVTCARYKAFHPKSIMGDLPAYRVQNHRVFLQVGMDYDGRYLVKEWKGLI